MSSPVDLKHLGQLAYHAGDAWDTMKRHSLPGPPIECYRRLCSPMRARVKAALTNCLIAVAATVLGYLLLELIFFRVTLPMLPFNIRPHLPEVPDILVQNTKRHYLPHDYIALLGDSYADGLGDWLLASNGNRGKPFHSANIIHDLTNRDVVTFGKGPSGSAEGLVLRPALIYAISDCYLFPSIEEPRQIVYYFFEGNDLEDNLHFIQKVRDAYGKADAPSIKRYLINDYANQSSWRCHRHFGDTMIRMGRFAFQYYVQNKDIIQRSSYTHNTLTIADKEYRAGPLSGPGLDLAPNEIEAALTVFAPSLAWLRNRFPAIPPIVVYIPSPLYVYAHVMSRPVKNWRVSPHMVWAVEDKDGTPANNFTDQASNFMCERIREMSVAHGAGFIDSRPALRRAAAAHPIHGPVDWGHLNEHGYRTLGGLVAERIMQSGPAADCKTEN